MTYTASNDENCRDRKIPDPHRGGIAPLQIAKRSFIKNFG
jgi:hypothetical protein